MKLHGGILVLSKNDLSSIVSRLGPSRLMSELIDKLNTAYAEHDSQKNISTASRSEFRGPASQDGYLEWTPLLERGGRFLMKLSSNHAHNKEEYNLPTVMSSLLLVDSFTGQLDAVIDGGLTTALSTGANSAIASRYMARDNSSVLGIIGCGCQAVTQVQAICNQFDIREIHYFDKSEAAMEDFQDRISDLVAPGCKMFKSTVEELVNLADILCTATNIAVKEAPLFSKTIRTKPFIHINAVGASQKGKSEIPVHFLRRCYVSPDKLSQAVRSGECQNLKAVEIGSELNTIVRHGDEYHYLKNKRTVFDSTGWVLSDLIVAELFLQYASLFSIGTVIPQEDSKSTRTPYSNLKSLQVADKYL